MHRRLRIQFLFSTTPLPWGSSLLGQQFILQNRVHYHQLIHERKRKPRDDIPAASPFASLRFRSSGPDSPEGCDEPFALSFSEPGFKAIPPDEFTAIFNTRPVAERAAAMVVARQHASGRVGLKVFVEQLPKVSRDNIFGSGMGVEEWLQKCLLLRLVEDAHGLRHVELTAEPKSYLADVDKDESETVNEAGERIGSHASEGTHRGLVGAAEKLLDVLRDDVLGRREKDEPNYKPLSEAYSLLLREGSRVCELSGTVHTVKYGDFLSLLRTPRAAGEFWVLHDRYICTRLAGESKPPRFVSPQPQTRGANSMNAYGGWAAASNVPTREDVYEILKYVPVNWGNFGNLNLPPAVKKKHIRISSTLQWFRRQPFYFELRSIAGTTEIRRSIVLHPEAHGLTPEEAHEQLQLKIAKGEANSLIPLNAEGEVTNMAGESQQLATILKFVSRVCPGYFVPSSLLMQRYTKKNLTHNELIGCVKNHPAQFEVVQLRYTDTPLVRRRIGANSDRWKGHFIEDFEQFPEDVRGLIILMGRVCTTWDRSHYVYVRLTEEEKVMVGGFEGMMHILNRHPRIFRVGENFIARVDLSDPLSSQEPEPAPGDMATRVIIREENPYQTPRDLAVVFHYVAPDDEPCTAAFFLQCASPAMRAVLPPRIVTVLQLFPDLFVCKETSPGVFLMRKVKKVSGGRSGNIFGEAPITPRTSGDARSPSISTLSSQANVSAECSGESLDLEAEFAENDFLSREEAVQAVRSLIPARGVEASQLLLWASLSVQQAANRHYGGVLKLVEANRAHFRIQDTPEAKMVFLVES
ncbi:hypothetical protein, conserved [Trypanosoma brucei gambiense DAL972]|uniref:Uncharacterized protein n=1 Tax=Trypanosoma brucei gambiense (strain MHOM/CI/86/DAL972) TaxID=679716 RepID=C9ZSN5_TRYB9|nr:hypothetical protein, conserved [Trypanosoma brucei gambiense DAL972]CBH12419.1 hypothetical protein, conserved [Trypanosoma brucei gambiense DAL972]|eukprot:XP_011774700.1 hypothetical protein, conserved [Trypanosoma brucei gambiense DAL972]